ncbi:C-terminal domain phosphatase-like 3 [Wolffia australiana]
MVTDGALLGEDEDGNLSYHSAERISDENLKRREFSRNTRSSRVWVGDSMGFSMLGRDYAANLYNFAWAQAVQNKPLVTFVAGETPSTGSGSVTSTGDVAPKSTDGSEIPDEKEEGELEEGEFVDEIGGEPSNDAKNEIGSASEGDSTNVELEEEIDFDSIVVTALEELEAINQELAEECFEEACSRLCNTLDGLKKIVTGSKLPVLDALVQQALMGVRTVYSVCTKRNNEGHESLLRLLSLMETSQVSGMFSPEQIEEVNEMMKVIKKQTNPSFLGSSANAKANNNTAATTATLPKIKVDHHPLLDLHGNYDEDSLPSPTSIGVHRLNDKKTPGEGIKISVPRQMAGKKDQRSLKDGTTFSTYQQKYVSSFLPPDELPSPTPSEECNDSDEELPEISSSSILNPASTSSKFVQMNCPAAGIINYRDNSIRQGLIPIPTEGVINPGLALPAKPSLRSRDPRLKHSLMAGNSVSFENSRKHPTDDGSLGNHFIKRQRLELPGRNDLPITAKNEGVIDGYASLVGQQGKIESRNLEKGELNLSLNDKVVRNDQVPAAGISPLVSLISLLKGVAGDPTILDQLMREQQKLAVQSQQKPPALIPALKTSSAFDKSSEAVPLASVPQPAFPVIDKKTNTREQQDAGGKIRMKSRDPRRILQSNMLQKSERDQMKVVNPPASVDQARSAGRAQEEPGQVSLSTSKSVVTPSATKQLNKAFKNPSDVSNDSPAPQIASQPLPSSSETANARSTADALTDQEPALTSGPSDPWGDMDHLLDGYDEAQKAAIQQERARRIEEQNRMIADRKLCLVLDLDHTLLNSAKFSEVDPVHEEMLRRKEEQDREKPQRSLFRFPHMGMWTKLRPGIWNFLEKTSKLFELHLYTMGNKLYATEMAKVLDPTGVLFAGRVISRGHDGDGLNADDRAPKSKDLDGVLGMESAVVIIDDSLRVWPHHKLNLIVVERYTYFPCSRRQFGMPGPSLLEIDHDERLEDGTLASSLAVIERIHRTFFASKSPREMDVRNIIAVEQRRILSGCRIVFSRIFPVGEANPHLHPLWQIAEQFGATCTNQIDDQVTHVVAYALGTDKVNWALSAGRFVVHPGWVEASALLYRRASEVDFAIKPLPVQQPQPP